MIQCSFIKITVSATIPVVKFTCIGEQGMMKHTVYAKTKCNIHSWWQKCGSNMMHGAHKTVVTCTLFRRRCPFHHSVFSNVPLHFSNPWPLAATGPGVARYIIGTHARGNKEAPPPRDATQFISGRMATVPTRDADTRARPITCAGCGGIILFAVALFDVLAKRSSVGSPEARLGGFLITLGALSDLNTVQLWNFSIACENLCTRTRELVWHRGKLILLWVGD